MATWRLELFLFPLTVWNGIMTSTQPRIAVNTKDPRTSTLENLFFSIIRTRALSTDRTTFADFSPRPKNFSNRTSGTSKIRMAGGGKVDFNGNMVSDVFKNGGTISNDVLILNDNGNFTVTLNASSLYLNDITIDVRNITDGNNTSIQVLKDSGNVASSGTNNFVNITVRCGIFFGGIFFIFLIGIGIYRAQIRCRPKWYEKV